MNKFSKIVYRIGGYDYKIIEKINAITTHFSLRYYVAGISLLLIFMTAGYGGWHFTATLIAADTPAYILVHVLSTILFASFIFFIDYLILNSGRNRIILIARIVLSLGLGSIIAILTTLSFFSQDISAEVQSQKNLRLKPIDSLYDSRNYSKEAEINTLENKISQSRDSAIAERQGRTRSGKPGPGGNWQEIHTNISIDSARLAALRANKKEETETTEADRKRERDKVEREFASNNFISQVKSLWRLMKEKVVSFYTFIFLISIIICDLIPLLAKISKEYSDEYDPYKEYIDSLKDKIKMKSDEILIDFTEIELIKARNDHDLAKFNEDALMAMNSLYAMEKYQELLEYFKTKNIPEDAIKDIFNTLQEKNKKN